MHRKVQGLLLLIAALSCAVIVSAQQPPSQPASAQQAAPPKTHLKVGDKAPDFKLKAIDGKEIKLSKFKGKSTVVLAFYPKAGTPG
jgi:cytochrome oxidase Cu insertion factor (SCO1/SenC/PrrC family)